LSPPRQGLKRRNLGPRDLDLQGLHSAPVKVFLAGIVENWRKTAVFTGHLKCSSWRLH